jgi:glycosyltransferase involved in cell wall biosynthesis
MTNPPLTVAMSVYNNAPYLALAIESIQAQTFADWEFLIVNDGSSDGSREIIDNFAARDPRIRAIHQENRGLVASLNRLVDEARAPLIARMDGDDISLPTRFEKQLAFLAEYPDHGVVGTWATCIDETGALRGDCGEKPITHEEMVAAFEYGPLLCHPSVIMRRDVVRGVGGYRAAYKHCEDYDLWLRLGSVTKLANLRERLILYRHSESQVSSKHVVLQQVNAAIAFAAYREYSAGRADPTEGLDELPALADVDEALGLPGLSREIRAKVAPNILYSPVALKTDGYDIILRYIREGGERDGMWRTAARLVTLGEPKRALRMAGALAGR